MLAPACQGVSRHHSNESGPSWSPQRTGIVRPDTPAGDQVWVAVNYEPLRGVLADVVSVADRRATVMSADQLYSALDWGMLPRGLFLEDTLLRDDGRLFAATYLADRVVVSTSDVMDDDIRSAADRLPADTRWISMPFTLDEFLGAIRWLHGRGEREQSWAKVWIGGRP